VFLTIDNGRIGSSEPSIRYKLVSSAKDAAFHDPTQISDKALAFWSAVHRRVANKPNLADVMSPQTHSGIIVGRVDVFDEAQGQWRQVLVEDRRATPAEITASRIDVAAWLHSLSQRNRRIAKTLAMGETTTDVARKFNLSRPRVSQLREELKARWEKFHERGQQHAGQI
jgi:hypothetical protein